MIELLLKSSACLASFLCFYKLCLEKEDLHVFKRFYLLASLGIAIAIPFITFTTYIEVAPVSELDFPSVFSLESDTVSEPIPTNYLPLVLWCIYGLGVLVFSLKFSVNLYKIVTKVRRNPKFKANHIINVLLQDSVTPHTFFQFIFLNKRKFESGEIPPEVLLHEETHAKQKHSLDILFIEFLQIIFWFNPLIYVLKHAIKLNHEFLADQAVIKRGTTSSNYQQILLAFSSNAKYPELANAINYSSIKKRFTVMKTKTTKRKFWQRSFLLLPLLGLLIYSFSSKEIEEKPYVYAQNISQAKIEKTNNEGATKEMMMEYRSYIKNYQEAKKKIINMPEYSRIVAIYNLMTTAQQAIVINHKTVIRPLAFNLSKTKKKTPTLTEFNNWKNAKKFAIWIDGKHVPNQELNKYNALDILYYSNSFVYKNARSEKFPQEYQNHLYTKKGFTDSHLKANVNRYNQLLKEYNNVYNVFTRSSTKDNSELRILKSKLDLQYNKLTKKEIKEYSIKRSIAVPEATILYKSNANAISQEEATKKMISEYNVLAKKYNAQPKNDRHIKFSEVNRLKYIYSLMTVKQRKNAAPFPHFPPPPTPVSAPDSPKVVKHSHLPPPPPIPANATAEEKMKYNKVIANYKKKNSGLVHTIKTEDGELLEIIEIPEEDRLPPPPPVIASRVVKRVKNLPPPPPIPANATVEEKMRYNKVIADYKNGNSGTVHTIKTENGEVLEIIEILEEDQLPPPPPMNPMDHLIKMAKKGATFYYNGKKVSSDKAIKLLKKDSNLSIKSNNDNGKHKVFISSSKPGSNTKTKLPNPTADTVFDHLKVMNRYNATFLHNSKKITFKGALKLLRRNRRLDVKSTMNPPVVTITGHAYLVGVKGK